ncbi:MAG: iron export ABC transporter permease subunit FetB [Treponemataceae bacterium]
MNTVIDLTFLQMLVAYIFVLILLLFLRLRKLTGEKEILLSCIRMTLQLCLAGYVLIWILKKPSPFFTAIILFAMEIFAVLNVFKRVKSNLSIKLKLKIAIAMITGTLVCIVYFFICVLQTSIFSNLQYFIPISGMLIGNTMTGLSLAVKHFVEGMKLQKDFVENALMLGATPKLATKEIADRAFDSAILPTVNSMAGMGIIFLPGMMTGQILSGISPLIAIKYQIAIMLGILGSVSLSSFIFVQIAYTAFFNDESQMLE